MALAAMDGQPLTAKQEWRQHWPVVVACMVGLAISLIHMYSLGIMIEPLQAEFGWSRAEIASSFLVITLVAVPLSPALGTMVDRLGPRRIALGGTALYSAALASLSLTQQAIWTWWALWALVALGYIGLSATVWVTAITSLFKKSRGLALAVSMSSGGIISFGGPILTYQFVDDFGWRMAYVIWALIVACIALPLFYFTFFSARDKDIEGHVARSATVDRVAVRAAAFRQMKSLAFFTLAFVALIMGLINTGFLVNLVPILTSLEIDTATAATLAGLVGITQVISRLASGYFLDRYDARYIAAIAVFFPVVTGFLLIAFPGSVAFAAIAVLAFGLAIGAEIDVMAYLAGRYFGLESFGFLFSIIIGLLVLGFGLAPIAVSSVYDQLGTYMPAIWALGSLSLVGSVLLFSLKPYPAMGEDEDVKGSEEIHEAKTVPAE